MKNRIIGLAVSYSVAAILMLAACAPAATEKEEEAPPTPTAEQGIIEIRVTDAPPREEVTSIMVTVAEVKVHRAATGQGQEQQPEQSGEGEWISIDISDNATTFDLLDIKGIEQFLGTSEVTAGKYTQVRLIVDTIQVALGDGELQDATVSSKELKLVRSFDVIAGETTAIVLDFDADRMVTVTGAGKILVQPVIKLSIKHFSSTGEPKETEEAEVVEEMVEVEEEIIKDTAEEEEEPPEEEQPLEAEEEEESPEEEQPLEEEEEEESPEEEQPLEEEEEETPEELEMEIASAAFQNDETIPTRYACDGQDISPALSWSGVPEGTQSFALIVDDPDAPGGTFTHWVIFNIPASTIELGEAIPTSPQLSSGALQGRNDFGTIGYGGPCPPAGTPHHYYFVLYALDQTLDIPAGASKTQVLSAIQGHILAQAQLTGIYQR